MQRGYYFDNADNQRIVKEDKKEEPTFYSLGERRNFRKSPVSLAAASISNQGLEQVLKRKQLEECGLAYINNGIVRTLIDKTVYFIHGERSNFVIEPNDELTEGLEDQEARELQDKINNSPDIKELRRKIVRVNKRCELHDRSSKLLTSTLIFGRNALEIARFPKSDDWPIFGEPKALKHLNSMKIERATQDSDGLFTGFEYAQDIGTTRKLKATDLIPAFHDDNNISDNTNYSGLSAVWPILEPANVIEAIIAEDMPEIARQFYAKLMIIYAGTSKKSTLRKLKEEIAGGTSLIHNEEQLKADVHDLHNNPMELMDVNDSLAKYMCMSVSLPQFLLFEDTANFATANQVMQAYKAGMLKRYRTWYQGILEKYWYDPILADHLGIELKDVISADIKIKAIFPDINFETRLDVVTADEKLQAMNVYNPIDTAKDIDRDDLVARLEEEEQARLEEEQAINDSIQRAREESIKGQQIANKIGQQNGQQPRKQPPVSNE